VRNTHFTISLVSTKSLQSTWIAVETISTFIHEDISLKKKFIACYIDEDFFQPEFTLKIIDEVDKQIKNNNDLISKYHEKILDTRDINNQNTRLYLLRNNLDEIVRRLRESLCLDIRENEFENSMKRLINLVLSSQILK
jgi:predicted ribosome quality control (RQC) complex YloA/Tae2 family protein